MQDLTRLKNSIKDCQKCGLSETRTHVVFGEGNPDADILFVGEAPGRNEDEQNRPFIGMAGKLLTGLLEKIGMTREDVFITNVVKCRPPENRNPSKEEIQACIPHLWEQIELIQPKLIATLGNFAAHAVLGRKVAITQVRGQHFRVNHFIVFPMLHPAAALHQGNLRPALEEDFQNLKRFLMKTRTQDPRPEQSSLI